MDLDLVGIAIAMFCRYGAVPAYLVLNEDPVGSGSACGSGSSRNCTVSFMVLFGESDKFDIKICLFLQFIF